MSLVLDTSVIFELENGNKDIIDKVKKQIYFYPDPAQISFMTYFEFYDGLRKKSRKNKDKAIEFINQFGMLETTKKTAAIMSNLRSLYETKGIIIQPADLFIASQVIENNLILITMDNGFEKIQELNKIIL